MPREPLYDFRALAEDDLVTLAEWLRRPHVAEWWGDADESLDEMRAAIDDIATEALIVELGGAPIAYLQSYDPHLEDGHPYRDQPTGTLGLDLTIGDPELLGKGHGAAIVRQYAALLFSEGAPRLIIDPDPTNGRAIRAYENAGFRHFDTRTSIYGPAHMMALDASSET